jgi:hypothetical protein
MVFRVDLNWALDPAIALSDMSALKILTSSSSVFVSSSG